MLAEGGEAGKLAETWCKVYGHGLGFAWALGFQGSGLEFRIDRGFWVSKNTVQPIGSG